VRLATYIHIVSILRVSDGIPFIVLCVCVCVLNDSENCMIVSPLCTEILTVSQNI
jgi:hypothetical protein